MRRGKPKNPHLSKANPPRPVDPADVRKTNPPRRYGVKNPMARGWTQRVFALYGRHCLACPKHVHTRAVQAHHLVPAQRIRNDARKTRAERAELEFDARNGFPICQRCHEQHETGTRRIPMSRIPALALEWAIDHGYEHVLTPPVYSS